MSLHTNDYMLAALAGLSPPPELPPDVNWPPPDVMPTKTDIMSFSGLVTTVGELTPSGFVSVTSTYANSLPVDGEGYRVLSNLDISGGIDVKVNNVKVYNCRIRGYHNVALAKITSGVEHVWFDQCYIEGYANPSNPDEGTNAIFGDTGGVIDVKLTHCEIAGQGEGIKAAPYSLYERNYVHCTSPLADPQHTDEIQASGRSFITVRQNVFFADIHAGASSCGIFQGWNSPNNVLMEEVHVSQNYFQGGNYALYMIGGKPNPGESDPLYDPNNPTWYYQYMRNCSMIDNAFEGTLAADPGNVQPGEDTRYGFYQFVTYTGSGNVASGNTINGV